MARSFKYTKLLLLSIFVFHAVFTPSETYFQLWFLDVSVQGMTQGCYQAFYLLTIIAGVQTLWQFLDRGQMLSGLIVLLFPLTFIGVSIDRLAVRISMILAALQHGLSLPDIQGIREKYATKNPLKLAAYAVVESIDSVKLENAQTEAELRYNATPPNAWEWLVPLATLGLLIWMMRLI